MSSNHQGFFGSKIVENTWQSPNAFWIKEKWESQKTIRHRQTFF